MLIQNNELANCFYLKKLKCRKILGFWNSFPFWFLSDVIQPRNIKNDILSNKLSSLAIIL